MTEKKEKKEKKGIALSLSLHMYVLTEQYFSKSSIKTQLASFLTTCGHFNKNQCPFGLQKAPTAAASKSKSDILESQKPIYHSIKFCGGYLPNKKLQHVAPHNCG